jgi:hypothetical protein
VVANDLRLDVRWVSIEIPAEMNAEALAIEKRTGTQHGCALRYLARDISERIGRIGYDDEYGIGRSRYHLGNDIAINGGVLIQEF